ncbi:zincin [Trematosphaeria pertusa]|uniref:Zincin n=1 Tax=Trematosphaeria pertusa TaxID=390896 RepID=A0A6A6HYM6_9PLEO|nr:zincin [Trematosphaeria pertusa]KAF2243334.1 zincin [Trematosphaeria pertusa]
MIKQLLLASLGLLALAAADSSNPQPKPFDCGTDTAHASEDFLNTIQSLHSNQASGSPAARAALAARDKDNNSAISVDAVFHIVAKQDKKGDITNDMPQAQLDALNEAYKDYGIQFNLINITWNTNDAWAVGDKDADLEMKKALRQGTYRTLNIYFQTDLSGGVLGRCTLPSNIANGKSDTSVYANDGCNVNANTMPDGAMDGYNRGKTAVHETGHWLGLLHTFEGNSCDGPGDYIDDTPMEKESTDGCPTNPPKSTCPQQPGSDKNDPIHNFMDYSTDGCYEGFTAMQHDRMHYMYNMYRDGN